MLTSTSFTQNGLVRLAYELSGEGEPVVLLHGLLGDRVTMRPLVDALAENHRVLSIDLRGHGGSSAVHGVHLEIADLAADVLAVLDTAGIDCATCVGVDLGALVTAQLGQRARRVIAVNPVSASGFDRDELARIADAAYKELAEKAVQAWLTLAWGEGWQDRVPKARVAAARRNAAALHPCLTALINAPEARADVTFHLPGGTPFADSADLESVIAAITSG